MKKKCKKCSIRKSIELFYKDKKGKYGVEGKCKKCRNITKKIYYKSYYEANSDKFKQYSKKYFGTEKGKLVSINRTNRRRAIINSAEKIKSSSLEILLKKQNNKCNICNCELLYKHLDHIYPLSKGGLHILNNLQWLCVTCNLRKGNKICNKNNN